MSATSPRYAAMQTHLQYAVPLRMMTLDARGGPTTADRAAAAAYETTLEKRSEDLIFGGGEQTALIADLVRAIAVLSHAPGGISIFGLHFQGGDAPIYGRREGSE